VQRCDDTELIHTGEGFRVRRILLVTGLAAVISCASLATASAAAVSVVHDRYAAPTDTGTAQHLCPFPVQITSDADVDDAYFYDRSGTLERLLETVQHVAISWSANGKTFTGTGTGGFDIRYQPDGSQEVRTFGINILLTIPGYGTVILDAGTAVFNFDTDPSTPPLQFIAGPSFRDKDALCAALAP
jgi:hypothetical protein